MKTVLSFLLPFTLLVATASAADPTHKLEVFKGAPKGLGEKITPLLSESGYRVTGPDGLLCEIWLAKTLTAKPDFKPSLFVKYPFTVGQLVGAVRFPESGAMDFRGQELPGGTFTLRYGQMPQDGNHLGKSETLDFFLACSPKVDTDPKNAKSMYDLFEMSAKAAGSSHPAIFLLEGADEKELKEATLGHNDDHDFWILKVNGDAKAGEKATKLPLHIVVAGISPEA